MVLDEQDAIRRNPQRRSQAILDPQLVEEPGGHRRPEDSTGARHGREHRLHDPVELDEWLFEEGNIVEIRAANACRLQAESNGALGKPEIVLDSREAFFFRRRNQFAVSQEGGRRVVEVARDAQYVHQNCRRASSSERVPLVRDCHCGSRARRRPRRTRPIGTTTTQYRRVRRMAD
jgi:hypothetical protein